MKYVLGIKKGMTRVYEGDASVPVTVIDQEGGVVCLVGKKGYEIGIGKVKKPNAALTGKYKELGHVPQFRYWVSEVPADVKAGDKVEFTADEKISNKVNVKAVSKGKGFAGVVKRWGFAGGPRTRGQSDRERAPGSIGAGTDPGRVFKGKKMGGRMGSDMITVKNKKIIAIKGNYVLVSGAVPGNRGGFVIIEVQDK